MAIFCLEGLDGSGKTEVGKRLAAVLGGQLLHFPDDEVVTGPPIRAYLRGQWSTNQSASAPLQEGLSPLLFQSLNIINRLEHWDELREACGDPQLHLVLSRYWQSAVVYGSMDGLDGEWLERVCECFPRSDLNILLEVAPKEALRRRAQRDCRKEAELYERLDSMFRVAAGFEALWSFHATHSPKRWVVVDANKPFEAVVQDVLSRVVQHIIQMRS